MTPSGDLVDFPLAELLFFLSSKQRTGFLTLRRGELVVTFAMRDGRLISAETNNARHRFGQRLVGNGALTTGQLAAALVVQDGRQPRPAFGEVLVDMGFIASVEVESSLRAHISDLLFQMIIHPGGAFTFERGLPNARGIAVDMTVEQEVLEAIRRADEWFYEQLQTAPICLAAEVSPELLDAHVVSDWPMLEALMDGCETLNEIVSESGWDRSDAVDALLRLHSSGIILLDDEATDRSGLIIART